MAVRYLRDLMCFSFPECYYQLVFHHFCVFRSGWQFVPMTRGIFPVHVANVFSSRSRLRYCCSFLEHFVVTRCDHEAAPPCLSGGFEEQRSDLALYEELRKDDDASSGESEDAEHDEEEFPAAPQEHGKEERGQNSPGAVAGNAFTTTVFIISIIPGVALEYFV